MRKKKNNKGIVTVVIFALIIVLILLIVFSKDSNSSAKLSLSEKKWIESNKKDVINISIANNIPAFSENGEGVFFDYIKNFQETTGLSLNLIPYDSFGDTEENDLYFEIIKHDKVSKIKDSDMTFYNDYYVLISKEDEKVTVPSEVQNKKIGVLTDDLADVNYYISSSLDVTYAPYKDADELKNAIKNDEVNYIAVPKMRYLSFILENKYHIVYNLTEMKETYVLKTSKDIDDKLKSIVNKSYISYKNSKLTKRYNKGLFDLLLTYNDVSEKERADLQSKKYVFGYIENNPYTNMVNNKLIGLDSTYINSFSKLSKASFTFKKYNSVNDLKNALNNGDVDIAPNYYNYTGLSGKYVKTISPYSEEYVILTHKSKTDVVVNSVKSLKDKEVITINSTLAKYIKKEGKAKITAYDKTSKLISKIEKNSIIVLDQNVYETYKDSKLSDYRVIYTDKENLEYGYIIKDTSDNKVFKSLFTNYMEMINYKQMYNVSWKNYSKDSKEISHTFIYFIIILVVLLIIWLFAKKKIKIKKITKREQAMRYIDPLTSLKNRNYLNKNFKQWESNAIYPQAIIVINLNNLRHVNDVYGHEEGDKLLKLAANTLIKNQLEQSDIIRTDGNEYLIYMVGYEKNKVEAYMRKLYKELGELPYGYGATLGYSMIQDDLKTIDDAINEAVLEIRANKEMNNNKNK